MSSATPRIAGRARELCNVTGGFEESNMKFPKDAGELSATGEYIPERADHWRVEPFIPIPTSDLTAYLEQKLRNGHQVERFRQVCRAIENDIHIRSLSLHHDLDKAYTPLDPDRDTSLLVPRSDEEIREEADEVTRLMCQALEAADYTELTHQELDDATKVASLWGVPLHVDFEIFSHLAVFARGDVVGMREFRNWRRLYRKELVEVQIYRRLVVLFQIKPDVTINDEGEADRLYLRMFKNIPKADVDMLLPGSRVRIGWLDRTKIFVPSLGGIGMSLWKLARLVLLVAVITTSKLLVLAGLLGATIGYIVRTITSYFQTKKNYELNLTRSLYFQKLDSNAGVMYRVLDEARQQDQREEMLVYYGLLTAEEPTSRRKLRRRIERMLREAIEVEIELEIDDAIKTLTRLSLITERNDTLQLV